MKRFAGRLLAASAFSLALLPTFAQAPAPQPPPAVQPVPPPLPSAERLRRDVEILASPAMGGRLAGTEQGQKAAAFVAEEFQKAGLMPAPGSKDYFQPFSFTASVTLAEGNALKVTSGDAAVEGSPEKAFLPASFSEDCDLKDLPVAFAGFGIRSKDPARDDYKGIDVKGKAVFILRGGPGGDDPKGPFAAFTTTRFKATIAKELGAAALLVIGATAEDDDLPKLRTGAAAGSAGLPVVSARRGLLEAILRPAGKAIPKAADLESPSPFEIPGAKLSLAVHLKRERSEAPNVLGFLPATAPSKETVVVGAHWDHLGTGIEGSLAEKWGQVHPGADDNASGVAGLLEMARHFAKEPARGRNLLFIGFAAEELGGLGSTHFTKNPAVPVEDIVAMINLDMIGRLKDNKLVVNGSGTSSAWKGIVESSNTAGLTLSLHEDGYGASDHSNFYGRGVPVLFFFTGAHGQYHLPDDTPDTLNYDGEAKIVALAERVVQKVLDLPARPDYLKTEASGPSGGGRNFRVYVGTVPDFTEEAKGFKILSVRAKSPAEAAGLKGGDLMVALGGKAIGNIYDYTYALQEYKPGQTVDVTVVREGKTLTFPLTFGKRPGAE